MRRLSPDSLGAREMQPSREAEPVVGAPATKSNGEAGISGIIIAFKNKIDVVGFLLCTLCVAVLFPLIPSDSLDFHLRGSKLESNYKLEECRSAAIVALTMCVLQLIELVVDIISRKAIEYTYLRFFSLSALAGYSLLYVAPNDYSNWVQIQDVVGKFQVLSEIGGVLWFIHTLDITAVWNRWVVVSLTFMCFTPYVLDYIGFINSSATFNVVADALLYLAYLSFFIFACIWCYVSRKELFGDINIFNRQVAPVTPNKRVTPMPLNTVFTIIVLVTLFIAAVSEVSAIEIIRSVYSFDTSNDVYSSARYRTTSFLIRTLLGYILSMAPTHLVRQRAIEYEYNVEVKTAFVKFFSHEIRNPMTSIAICIDLLHKQISVGEILTAQETIKELHKSSEELEKVLDNLLLYELIEKGTLQISQTDVLAVDFMTSTLRSLFNYKLATSARILLLPSIDFIDKRALFSIDEKMLSALVLSMYSRAIRGSTCEVTLTMDIVIVKATRHDSIRPYRKQSLEKMLRRMRSERMRVREVNANGQREEEEKEYMQITVELAQALSEEEQRSFLHSRLDFYREAHDGSGGFQLVAWILKEVASLLGGEAGFVKSDSKSDVIYLKLPFTRKSDLSQAAVRAMIGHVSELNLEQENAIAGRREALPSISAYNSSSEYVIIPHPQQLPMQESHPVRTDDPAPPEDISTHVKECQASATPPLEASRWRVLVVDDGGLCRRMQIRLMESFGHVCEEAVDGKIGLDMAIAAFQSGAPYDLILLDNEMPVMKGVEAMRLMRVQGYSGLVIGVTGNALKEDIEEFQHSGIDDIVLKPLTAIKCRDAMNRLGRT